MTSKKRKASDKLGPSVRPHHWTPAQSGPPPTGYVPPASGRSRVRRRRRTPSPPYEETFDPTLVDRPVPDLVHPKLACAWKINKDNQMCLIFDVVNPVRKFKRDSVYNDADKNPFTEHDDPNLSETDADPPWKPAYPVPSYQCVDWPSHSPPWLTPNIVRR